MQPLDDHSLFDKNLAVIRKHRPKLYQIIQPHLLKHPIKKIESNPMQERTLSSVIMNSVNQGMDFLYFIGLGSGEVLNYCASEIISKNRGILVIEPSIEIFFNALSSSNFISLLKNKRMFWVVGPSYELQIKDIMDQTWCFLAAKPMIHSGAIPETPDTQKQTENIVSFIQQNSESRKNEFKQLYQNLPDDLNNRSIEQPRIWSYLDLRNRAGYTLIQHVLLRTIFHYLNQDGFKTEYLTLRPGCYYPPYYRHYRMMVFKPDLIFLCNDSPAFETALGAELTRSLPIPKVVWYADDPIHSEHLFQRNGVESDEHFLVADYEWKAPIIEYGGKNPVEYLPGAATKIRRGKKRASRKCEIVFVGQVRNQQHFFSRLPDAWKQWCEKVIQEKLRFPRMKIKDTIQKHPPPSILPQDRMDELRQKVLWEANTRFRLQVIRPLLSYDLMIYGNDDWLSLLPEEAAQKCFKGILRFKNLFEVYRNAKITINIHSLQSYTCLNVRDFDVPAAGGFLISDWLPHADEIFNAGFVEHLSKENTFEDHLNRDIYFYRSIPEMLKLIDYFLDHENERNIILDNAREKILSNHTYKHRAEWLAKYFNQLIKK